MAEIDFVKMLRDAKRQSRAEQRQRQQQQQQKSTQSVLKHSSCETTTTSEHSRGEHGEEEKNGNRTTNDDGTTTTTIHNVRNVPSASCTQEEEEDVENFPGNGTVNPPPPPIDVPCCHTIDLDNNNSENGTTVLQQHRLSPIHTTTTTTTTTIPDLKHVYYIPQCLTSEFTTSLLSWLSTLPHIGTSTPLHAAAAASATTGHQQPDQSTSMDRFHGRWTRLRHAQRNVAVFDLSTNTSPPPHLQSILDLLGAIHAFPPETPPNHVLINEYGPSEGIMPHTDGPMYLNRTATFSIGGGDVLFKFRRMGNGNGRVVGSVDDGFDGDGSGGGAVHCDGTTNGKQHPTNKGENDDNDDVAMEVKLSGNGSLIVFTDDAYTYHRHSIDDRVVSGMEVCGTKCVNCCCGGGDNVEKEDGRVVKRGYRVSLTFRHKY